MNFPTTNWTQLADATLSGDTTGANALNALCHEYRAPVVHFLQQRGRNPHDADDLAHQFFEELIRSKAWRGADRSKGRFRSFLLGILSNVVSKEHRRNGADKRGGSASVISLDEVAPEDLIGTSLAGAEVEFFDRHWALQLVTSALRFIESKFTAEGKLREWAVLLRFLPGAGETPSYEDAAAELGMALPALKTAVHRVRNEFRSALRRAVARTVSAAHEVDDELTYLHRVLKTQAA